MNGYRPTIFISRNFWKLIYRRQRVRGFDVAPRTSIFERRRCLFSSGPPPRGRNGVSYIPRGEFCSLKGTRNILRVTSRRYGSTMSVETIVPDRLRTTSSGWSSWFPVVNLSQSSLDLGCPEIYFALGGLECIERWRVLVWWGWGTLNQRGLLTLFGRVSTLGH